MIFDISLRCLLVDLNLKYAFFNLFIVSKRGSCVSVNRTFVCTFHVHYACMQIHLNQYRLRWTITIQCTIQLFMCLWRFSFSTLSERYMYLVRCLILIPLSRILIAIRCVEITTKQSFNEKKIELEPPEQIQYIIALASLQAKRKTSCNTMFVSIFICIWICCCFFFRMFCSVLIKLKLK